MDRLNPEGIPREHLRFALRNRRLVSNARRLDKCLLCLHPRVNEAALCDLCYGQLAGEEAELALKWMRGDGP